MKVYNDVKIKYVLIKISADWVIYENLQEQALDIRFNDSN